MYNTHRASFGICVGAGHAAGPHDCTPYWTLLSSRCVWRPRSFFEHVYTICPSDRFAIRALGRLARSPMVGALADFDQRAT
eukprot:9451105-Alexandrium_andersonii.AAC.1